MTPYDEAQVIIFAKQCDALLHPDSGRVGVMCARMQFDAAVGPSGSGMGYPASMAKHLAELQNELGTLGTSGTSGTPIPFDPSSTPDRMKVLGINMHFRGGLIVQSPTYGNMPWWPSALSWCDSPTRKLVYATVKGDTHCIIEIPNGLPLYDESNQFYSPSIFGPLDWTNGETFIDSRLSDLVDEVIAAGFYYILAMDERPDHSARVMQLALNALSKKQLSYGLVIPGYDGVFYGWTPQQITQWSVLARAIQGDDVYLGIEHQPGRIPVGNGPADYIRSTGAMDGFDALLGEFDSNLKQDSTWQVLGRCIRPYNRPIEQPANDDVSPPFYLVDSPRGPRAYCAFETNNPYNWVRVDMSNQTAITAVQQTIQAETDYFRQLGCDYVG